MNVSVQTGHSNARAGTLLAAHKFTSALKEQVCLVLQIEAEHDDAKTLEKECMAVFKHALLETEGGAAERLDGCLKELNGLFKGLALAESVDFVHAIASIIDSQGVLHVSHAGRAEAYIIRGGSATQITEYTRGKPTPGFVHIASGALEPRDTVVLSSQRLLRTLTPAQLAQMALRGDQLLHDLVVHLNTEEEHTSLGILHVGGTPTSAPKPLSTPAARGTKRGGGSKVFFGRIHKPLAALSDKLPTFPALGDSAKKVSTAVGSVVSDLKHPERKRRAHLLLLATAAAAFLIVWAGVQLTTSGQTRQTRELLEKRLQEVEAQIESADHRRLAGDIQAATMILQQAEDRAKQVLGNDQQLLRTEALDLVERIRSKREKITNVIRLSPRTIVSLATVNPNIEAQGLISLDDGEFMVYDRQNRYRILLNALEEPQTLDDEELIAHGARFERYQTEVYQTTTGEVIEIIDGQPISMKTDDQSGWIRGSDIATYLRFLYVLSPENNQIYKYERLSNRYGAPVEYNVSGQLDGGLDIAIDGNVYVLKEGGEVVRLFRGEARPFSIRNAPEGVLNDATRIYKTPDSRMYFLDPDNRRIVIATDGGASGESAYIKQYILEGEDIEPLKDFWVDLDEARMYVLDEKRLYVVDLTR